jgi:hypothetical protein
VKLRANSRRKPRVGDSCVKVTAPVAPLGGAGFGTSR